ncbi:unnamed protein product [Cylindrotheca closterium]|uniref:Uncharacterized protein n=1 Tax=Cylindrotheca closterium TaxID=2856 RepID=A0AAD2G951_9STRA|nr:unnamed protein product [Cylindrotheca closterium]
MPDFLNLPDSLSHCANFTTIDTEPLDRFACAGLQSFQNYCCPGDGIYACEFCTNGLDNIDTFLLEKNVSCSEYQYRAIFAGEEQCMEDFKPVESLCCSESTFPPAATLTPSKAVKEGQCVFCSNGLINETLVMPEFLNLPPSLSSCANLNAIDTEPLDKFACLGLLSFQNYCCPGEDVFACEFCSSGLDNPNAIVPEWNETCSQFRRRAVFADEGQCEGDHRPMESLCCPGISSSAMKQTQPLVGLVLTVLTILVGFFLD